MLHTIESVTPFDVVFMDFWDPRYIPDLDGSRNNLACLHCMKIFDIISASVLKSIRSYQDAQWGFGDFFVPFGTLKMIVVDADGIFLELSRRFSKKPY